MTDDSVAPSTGTAKVRAFARDAFEVVKIGFALLAVPVTLGGVWFLFPEDVRWIAVWIVAICFLLGAGYVWRKHLGRAVRFAITIPKYPRLLAERDAKVLELTGEKATLRDALSAITRATDTRSEQLRAADQLARVNLLPTIVAASTEDATVELVADGDAAVGALYALAVVATGDARGLVEVVRSDGNQLTLRCKVPLVPEYWGELTHTAVLDFAAPKGVVLRYCTSDDLKAALELGDADGK